MRTQIGNEVSPVAQTLIPPAVCLIDYRLKKPDDDGLGCGEFHDIEHCRENNCPLCAEIINEQGH